MPTTTYSDVLLQEAQWLIEQGHAEQALEVLAQYQQRAARTTTNPTAAEQPQTTSAVVSSTTTNRREHARPSGDANTCSPDSADGCSLDEWIVGKYSYYLGQRPAPFAIDEIKLFVSNGLPRSFVESALQDTAGAPRPSWRYLRAILVRMERDGSIMNRDWAQD